MTAFTTDKRFRLVIIQHIRLEKNTAIGRMEKALNNASPTIYGTPFRGHSRAQRIIILLVMRAWFV
jgi:hypothetical protein